MSHSGYKCKNCGATASSKCAARRAIFFTNQSEAVLSNIMQRNVRWRGNFNAEVRLYIQVGLKNTEPNNNRNEKQALGVAMHIIREMSDETIDQWICDHEWQITEGECMFGCCIAPEE